ncbi:MAG: hypothetical protein Kow0075_09490 [Salibacteraceae bacterium]
MRALLTLLLLSTLPGCEKNIFGPNKGTLSGYITDENGHPIRGVAVKAVYVIDENVESPEQKTAHAVSNQQGYYEVMDLGLTENTVSFEKFGYQSSSYTINISQEDNTRELNETMIGAPVYVSSDITKVVLSDSLGDSTLVSCSVKDLYQESASIELTLLVYDHQNNLSKSLEMNLTANSSTRFEFRLMLYAKQFTAGEYTLGFEIDDNETPPVLIDEAMEFSVTD